jgi:predicted MFS family arabinose efflux permease
MLNKTAKDPTAANRRNSLCLTLEGGFNVLATDMLGIASVVPLFLQEYGAGPVVIGMLPALQTGAALLVPLLLGNFVSGLKSKKRFNVTMNGVFRPSVLLIALALLLLQDKAAVVAVFIAVIVFFFLNQSATGLAWNHLLAASIRPQDRGALMGRLFALSGAASFLSSFLIKAMLDSEGMAPNLRYAAIFGMAGVAYVCSILSLAPLRENTDAGGSISAATLRGYAGYVVENLTNPAFRRLMLVNALSVVAACSNAFLYVYAQNAAGLPIAAVSVMIVVQTTGQVFSGLLLGRVSKRFGNKYVILLSECFAALIPAFMLAAWLLPQHAAALCLAAAFCFGFRRGGDMGYNTYLYGIVEPRKVIYGIVAKSSLLFPVSFAGMLAGYVIGHTGYLPVFFVQFAASALALLCCAGLAAQRLRAEDAP